MKYKKSIASFAAGILIISATAGSAGAARFRYTIKWGDTLWKIASRYKIGISEIISENPKITTPDVIVPGDTVEIPSADQTVSEYEAEVIRLVNEIRVQYGLKKLETDWELSRVARYKSQDMADKNYFSHTSPTYGSPFDMMKKFGISYRSAAENIAKGQRTPKEVVNAWMNSSGHRKNILNSSYTRIGVGYVSKGNIWTQMFIGK